MIQNFLKIRLDKQKETPKSGPDQKNLLSGQVWFFNKQPEELVVTLLTNWRLCSSTAHKLAWLSQAAAKVAAAAAAWCSILSSLMRFEYPNRLIDV